MLFPLDLFFYILRSILSARASGYKDLNKKKDMREDVRFARFSPFLVTCDSELGSNSFFTAD